MSKIQVRVDGDAKGGFIVEVHDGDHHRVYSPECDHPMHAAQVAAEAFAREFPASDDADWDHPVDRSGKKLAHPDDYHPTSDGELDPLAEQDSKAAGPLAAAGSADAGSGDVGDGAPEVSGKVPNGPQPSAIEPTSDAQS